MSTKSVTHHQLQFVNDEGILLSGPEQETLAGMFAGYERLVLKDELGGGLGGGRILLVRPITSDSAELPAIVKMGPAAIIKREWAAFDQYVRRKVPKVAHIEGEPVFTVDASWGGIRYPLAGDGRFPIKSLATFCQQAATEDIVYVLEHQLFPSMDALWQDAQPVHEFSYGRSLDAVLPVNLVVTYRAGVTSAPELHLGRSFAVGDEISLTNVVVIEVDGATGELTLDLPPDKDNPAGGKRVRVTAVPNAGDYQVGQLLPHPLTGVVHATRNTLFQAQLDRLFDSAISATAVTITLPGMGIFSNPLAALPDILKQRGDARVGVIHGDLNLENVLVEYDHQNRNIHLIDFANARRDWVLHDLLRLETNVWLHLVPEEMRRYGRSVSDLPHFIASLQHALTYPNQIGITPGFEKPFHLLLAIRRQAQHLLMSPHAWDAYWQGLTVYLVGALKFQNLDRFRQAPLPKQVALVAAVIIHQPQYKPPVEGKPFTESRLPKSELLREIKVTLQECEPFESQHQLRAFFAHPELKPWRNRLPEEHRLTARIDGTVALLHNRHSKDGQNALVTLLHVLSQEPSIDEEFQPQLASLARQLEASLRDET